MGSENYIHTVRPIYAGTSEGLYQQEASNMCGFGRTAVYIDSRPKFVPNVFNPQVQTTVPGDVWECVTE